jgi:hypothetical protein
MTNTARIPPLARRISMVIWMGNLAMRCRRFV